MERYCVNNVTFKYDVIGSEIVRTEKEFVDLEYWPIHKTDEPSYCLTRLDFVVSGSRLTFPQSSLGESSSNVGSLYPAD